MNYADSTWPEARKDLATLFLERCLELVAPCDDARVEPAGAGTVAAVTPQNWLFLGAYREMRQALLERHNLNSIVRLGSRAFWAISGEVVNVALPIVTATPAGQQSAFLVLDVSAEENPEAKAQMFQFGDVTLLEQKRQRENPDYRIVLEDLAAGPLLQAYADSIHGLGTKDSPRFIRNFWERAELGVDWEFMQSTVRQVKQFDGLEYMIFWEQDKGILFERGRRGEEILAGRSAFGREGVTVSQMGSLPASLYMKGLFDNNTAVIIPKNPDHLPAIWAFCSSPEFNTAVRKIDAALKVTNQTLLKVPFDLGYWQKVAEQKYPDGLPEPYSSDPTQWLFDGTVPGSDHPLQVAMARLLGYRWPDQADDGLDSLVDPDGIACLPSVYSEPPAAQRLETVLRTAHGDAWSPETLAALLKDVGAKDLASWLRAKTGFFAQHVKLFHNRPFLWQITDGHPDGFAAVVNYHRLDANTLSKLIYTYLGDWIARQERAVEREEPGAAARLESATALRTKLIAIAEGEPPYDIYVRWKSLAEQRIGWQPDLNDGVRLNIRPWIEAGVLAAKVNVKWGKDRGKDPAVRSEPLLQEATGELAARIERHASVDRHNDLHFTVAEKERARWAPR